MHPELMERMVSLEERMAAVVTQVMTVAEEDFLETVVVKVDFLS